MPDTATSIPAKTERNEKAPVPARTHSPTPFDTLRQEIDRVFDNFGLRPWRSPLTRNFLDFDFPALPAANPAVDLVEKNDTYEITMELPGLDEKDIDIRLADDTLTIRGEKKEEKTRSAKDYYLAERRYGSFVRSFRLPKSTDIQKVDASFANGVLTVKVPKNSNAEQNERKIPVKTA